MADLFCRSDAGLSPCGRYRYWLTRVWDPSRPLICWIMLNPSTADANMDDPTIRRCMGFARTWGAGGIVVVNLFAFRSPKPTVLPKAADPVGPENDATILEWTVGRRVIAAWGGNKFAKPRVRRVMEMLADRQVECLKLTDDGHPWHPLYVAGDRVPIPFPRANRTPLPTAAPAPANEAAREKTGGGG